MTPLLAKSKLAKVIFISSRLGSISRVLKSDTPLVPLLYFNSSKSAMNMLSAHYSRQHPTWKVNTGYPSYRSTGLSGAEKNEETNPRNDAIRAVELVLDGPDGITGTYSKKQGPLSW